MTRFIENDIAQEIMKNSKPALHETAIRVCGGMPQKLTGGSFSDECDSINAIVEAAMGGQTISNSLTEGKELPRNYVGQDEPEAVKQKPEPRVVQQHVGKPIKAVKGKPEQNKTVKKKYVGESRLQAIINKLTEKAEKLGESKVREHQKLAFFISERLLPFAAKKTEDEGGDAEIMKDLASALRMLATKLTDGVEKKDLNDMAFSMAKPEDDEEEGEVETLESVEEAHEVGGPLPEVWKIFVNGELVRKTKQVDSYINQLEMDGMDVEEEWDNDKKEVHLTVVDPEETVESVQRKKKALKENEESEESEKEENEGEECEENEEKEPLKEEHPRWLANELDAKYHPLVSEASKKLGYDVTLVPKFCVALLENVNAHPEAKAVNDALLKFMDESKEKMSEAEDKKSHGKFAKNKIKPGEMVWHKGRKATVQEYHGGNSAKIRIQGSEPETVEVSELEAFYPDQAEQVSEAKKPEAPKFQVGDKVKMADDALQKHARSVPAHMGYTKHQMDFRKELSDIQDAGTEGEITRVFPNSDNVNVSFGGKTFGVNSYMLKKV